MSRARERGASLIETIAALAVVVILAAVAVPGAVKLIEHREQVAASARLTQIELALERFYADIGRLPTAGEGLAALITNPSLSNWRGPYLEAGAAGSGALLDPRGTAYSYSVSGITATIGSSSVAVTSRTMTPARIVTAWTLRAQAELAVVAAAAERRRAASAFPSTAAQMVGVQIGSDGSRDPWGRDYQIDSTNQIPYSMGPDGVAGNADDIYPPGYDGSLLPAVLPAPTGSGGANGDVTAVSSAATAFDLWKQAAIDWYATYTTLKSSDPYSERAGHYFGLYIYAYYHCKGLQYSGSLSSSYTLPPLYSYP